MSPAGRNEAGFTLIELMVAMVLLGLLTAVVYPSLAGLGRRNIDQSAASVVDRLRAFRHEALQSGLPREVNADELLLILPDTIHLEGLDDGPLVLLPNGASSGGELLLQQGGDKRRIVIDWLTGHIGLADD